MHDHEPSPVADDGSAASPAPDAAGALPEQQAPQVGPAPPLATTSQPALARRGRLARALVVVAVIAAAALLRMFVYESDIVEGASMHPGLRSGDYVLIFKLAYRVYRVRPPRRFDVVTFRSPAPGGGIVIKRVVGLPGEWVWAFGDHVFVGGGRLVEPYAAKWSGSIKPPVWVPPGHIYVLGDNRGDSEDSRFWGPIPLSSLRGRAICVYLPFHRARVVR